MENIQTNTDLTEINLTETAQLPEMTESEMTELSADDLDSVAGGFWGWTWGQRLLYDQMLQNNPFVRNSVQRFYL